LPPIEVFWDYASGCTTATHHFQLYVNGSLAFDTASNSTSSMSVASGSTVQAYVVVKRDADCMYYGGDCGLNIVESGTYTDTFIETQYCGVGLLSTIRTLVSGDTLTYTIGDVL
jgi:hypothetical protein